MNSAAQLVPEIIAPDGNEHEAESGAATPPLLGIGPPESKAREWGRRLERASRAVFALSLSGFFTMLVAHAAILTLMDIYGSEVKWTHIGNDAVLLPTRLLAALSAAAPGTATLAAVTFALAWLSSLVFTRNLVAASATFFGQIVAIPVVMAATYCATHLAWLFIREAANADSEFDWELSIAISVGLTLGALVCVASAVGSALEMADDMAPCVRLPMELRQSTKPQPVLNNIME